MSNVDHPPYYGGADNPYEAIRVIDAWGLGFSLGNAVKYIARAGKKDPTKTVEDLEKAAWYLAHEIERLKAVAPTAALTVWRASVDGFVARDDIAEEPPNGGPIETSGRAVLIPIP